MTDEGGRSVMTAMHVADNDAMKLMWLLSRETIDMRFAVEGL